MGLLTSWFRSPKPLLQLHSGSFSMDRTGRILATTLPSTFPHHLIVTIGLCIAVTFQEAQTAQMPLSEIIVHYPGLRITAREMRGGAMIFLSTASSLTDPTHKTS
jgi:hypothetical protein